MMKLTSGNVKKVFEECLGEADGENITFVNGIITNFAYQKDKLEENKQNIIDMLFQLPENFRESVGGGWSFLEGCMTKEDVQWGEHRDMERLFTLGIGIEVVSYMLPRTLWRALPGGMPYLVIHDKDLK